MIGLSHSMLQLAKYLTGDDFSITKPVREPITLPLFERDLQSLKSGLRQNSLPKVQFATYGLPTGFFTCSEKRQAVCARKIGSCSRLYLATRQGYVAMNTRSQFRAA
jgi:hypothetical protein